MHMEDRSDSDTLITDEGLGTIRLLCSHASLVDPIRLFLASGNEEHSSRRNGQALDGQPHCLEREQGRHGRTSTRTSRTRSSPRLLAPRQDDRSDFAHRRCRKGFIERLDCLDHRRRGSIGSSFARNTLWDRFKFVERCNIDQQKSCHVCCKGKNNVLSQSWSLERESE